MWRVLRKLKIKLPHDPVIPLLGAYPDKTVIQKDGCAPMFTAAVFTTAKTWKQPKCSLTGERIKKMWYIYIYIYIYTMKYCVCEWLSHVWLFVNTWAVACQIPPSMEFSRQEYWSGFPYCSLLEGIFLTQVSNPGLLHCRWILTISDTREAGNNYWTSLCVRMKYYLVIKKNEIIPFVTT